MQIHYVPNQNQFPVKMTRDVQRYLVSPRFMDNHLQNRHTSDRQLVEATDCKHPSYLLKGGMFHSESHLTGRVCLTEHGVFGLIHVYTISQAPDQNPIYWLFQPSPLCLHECATYGMKVWNNQPSKTANFEVILSTDKFALFQDRRSFATVLSVDYITFTKV